MDAPLDFTLVEGMSEDELLAAVRLNCPREWGVEFGEEPDAQGVWTITFEDAEGNTLFTSSRTDCRTAILDGYGFLWRRQHKPTNPVWQRRRHDLREVARQGVMYVPGAENVPDPDDLDPASVYEGSQTRRPR